MKARLLLIGGLLIAGCATAPTSHQDPVADAMSICVTYCAVRNRAALGMLINATKRTFDCACSPVPLPTPEPL